MYRIGDRFEGLGVAMDCKACAGRWPAAVAGAAWAGCAAIPRGAVKPDQRDSMSVLVAGAVKPGAAAGPTIPVVSE